MAKVDWITWKTNIKEIINPEQELEEINNNIHKLNNIINQDIYVNVNREKLDGGLNEKSLNLNGISPSSIKTDKILKKLEVVLDDLLKLQNKVKKQAFEQKEIEKEQLANCIKQKIEEQEKVLENTENIKAQATSQNTDAVSIKELDDILEVTRERIRILKEKLNTLQNL